jgi:hypothetical protein
MTETLDLAVDGARGRLYLDAPSWEGPRTAALGGFACESEAGGVALIELAKQRARERGCAALIGPMDGDTWHRYRVVVESDGSPPFLLEPTSGAHDKAAFAAAGFAPISEYVSSRARLEVAILHGGGAPGHIAVTPWDGGDVEGLVGRMFDMSLAAFARNRFYKPISREAFVELYRPVLPFIDPRGVLFARDAGGRLVGFLFGYPNGPNGGERRSVILKTYASFLPGAGRALADRFHRDARAGGFEEVIHALMNVDNISRARSTLHGGEVFRRYALMGARL